MDNRSARWCRGIAAVLAAGWGLMAPEASEAHCDTMDGPVVSTARIALDKGQVTPVLKWVQPAEEGEVQEAFTLALAARQQGGAAREIADRFFFETVVRLHRAGEDAPYTGLKPGGEVEPAIAAADASLAQGAVEPLITSMTAEVTAGIKTRFAAVIDRRSHAEESVAAGREYVEAYVEYVHYVERLAGIAGGLAEEHGEGHSDSPVERHH